MLYLASTGPQVRTCALAVTFKRGALGEGNTEKQEDGQSCRKTDIGERTEGCV